MDESDRLASVGPPPNSMIKKKAPPLINPRRKQNDIDGVNENCATNVPRKVSMNECVDNSKVVNQEKDVRLVVAKAKRAAASLWMVLHAQTCLLDGTRCPHQGCKETKILLLHVKSCAAGSDFDCPRSYHGCNQARKLLSHYQRCRKLRARQTGITAGRGVRYQQHHCLVCTLVARYARNVLEGGIAPVSSYVPSKKDSSKVAIRSNMIPPPLQSLQNPVGALSKKPIKKRMVLKDENLMPPPPARPPHADRVNFRPQIAYGTPPTTSQLMQNRIVSIAKVADHSRGFSQSSMLNKSVESSMDTMESQMNEMERENDWAESHEALEHGAGLLVTGQRPPRRRAESFDQSMSSIQKLKHSQSYPQSSNSFCRNDPTLEITLRQEQLSVKDFAAQGGEDIVDSSVVKPVRLGRSRSSSCGLLSAIVHPGGCDTILEET